MCIFRCVVLTLALMGWVVPAYALGWEGLLDKSLSKWEKWIGVPHSSVTGLPVGTYQNDNLGFSDYGKALGLNNDPKEVFSVLLEQDEPVLSISGEIWGALTTQAEYQDYQLSMQVRWGDKKWEHLKGASWDGGLYFHCKGDHGAVWITLKACLEFDVREGAVGAFFAGGGASGEVRGIAAVGNKFPKYDPAQPGFIPANPFLIAPSMNLGGDIKDWKHLELYTLGTNAVFVVNSKVVMVVEDIKDKYGNPLSRGQIQLASEGSEIHYKDIKIHPIKKFPEHIAAQLAKRAVPLR